MTLVRKMETKRREKRKGDVSKEQETWGKEGKEEKRQNDEVRLLVAREEIKSRGC